MYIELHAHSFYSLLDGASSPEALLDRAAALGMPALALTDHDNLYGAVRFWRAARERGIHPIIGAEVTLAAGDEDRQGEGEEEESGCHLLLLAEDQTGYANLCRLLSQAHLGEDPAELARRLPHTDAATWPGKTAPRLSWQALNRRRQGLIALTGCRRGPLAAALLAGDEARARQHAGRLRAMFGRDHLFVELQRHLLPDEPSLLRGLLDLGRRMDLPFVATNNVHYALRRGQRLQDVLVCIRHLCSLDEARGRLRPNSEFHLKPAAEMKRLFARQPDALANTQAIAERCQVDLDFSGQRLPAFPAPQGHTPFSYLYELCQQGLHRRFQPVTPAASRQLAYELDVIERSGLAGYFLIVWDIVRFARSRGIRSQGRGSAANSLVAYLLDITPVDPLRFDLLFDRFLSPDSQAMPDIDIDFAADRREEVIQYVYGRYGHEHTAMVCNVNTFRARSAMRDVGRALGLAPDMVAALQRAQRVDEWRRPEWWEAGGVGATGGSPVRAGGGVRAVEMLMALCREIDGAPRHLSIHSGGMIVTARPLAEIVPLERAAMPGRVVVQWDKDSVEDAGLIKIDLLSLRTLGMVDEIARLVEARGGQAPDLDALPLDDPAVYDALCRGDTIGAFQVESRAQVQMLPRLRPRRFEDIVVEVAIVRPGPIQGNMVHPYLRRRQGQEAVSYPHPALEPVLAETLGVILFQEQVLRVAMIAAGFSGGEADRLRRAMSRQRSAEEMQRLGERFVQGAGQRGMDAETAAEVFRQLAGFASYGFCKSHAAAFALLSYQTTWLKLYHPAEFYCALLNHQPMGFYSPAVVMGDAQRHGVAALPPDVNLSEEHCTLEGAGLRLGLRYVKEAGPAATARLLAARAQGGAFTSLDHFCRRTRLPRPAVQALVRAGALDGLHPDRRLLLWELGALDYRPQALDLESDLEPVALPRLTEAEAMAWGLELLGMTPGDHPLRLLRPALQAAGVRTAADLERCQDGAVVKAAGQVVVRQSPPTAKGHLFITLEDETGLANLIVRPDLYKKRREALRYAPVLGVVGRVQRAGEVCSVLVFDVWQIEGWPG